MNDTANGKIARLPHPIREQISMRLRDGQKGKQIVAWLNDLPEVKEVIAAYYPGRPIKETNITEWKKRSHRQWLLDQAALSEANRFVADSRQLVQAGEGVITDHLATYVAARYALARGQLGDASDPQANWKLLRALCHDVVALRRGDQLAQSLNLKRLRQQLSQPKPPPL